MTSLTHMPTVSWQALQPGFMVAQMSQRALESARQQEIERLRNSGRNGDHAGDFAFYVVLPICVLLCLVGLGRRLLS
jgi:hypothetical protein